MDGAALVGGHGEGGLADHGLQGLLLQGDAVLVVHLRQLRIVVGGQTQNVEAGVAAAEMHHVLLIGGKDDDIVRHLADDIAEQPGIEDDAALLPDLRLEGGADTGLGVVAGQGQLTASLQQKALQRGNGAFGGHGAAGGGDRRLQQRFFTGEFQHNAGSFPVEPF